MSGHSKWSTIKRKKGAADAKRGQQFSKLARMITVAVKEGGPDPEMNFKLRLAIDKAKEANMPSVNIERAISGASKEGFAIEEITYEAYGPEGIALLIRAVTDNRNRASSEIKAVLAKHNGSLGSPGSVSYLFKQKGLAAIDAKNLGEDKKDELELLAIDLGAEDIKEEGDLIEIYTMPKNLHKVSAGLKEKGFKIESENLEMNPENSIEVEAENKAKKILNLVDALEELEDVEEVFSNFDIADEIMEKIS